MAASTAHSMTPLPAPPPALAPATVMRPRLERRLDACTARPVTVVTAPAGFGKTLLLASWAARNGAAWLQLHPVHCDVARLWRDVAHALQTLGLEASVDLPGPAALACRVHLRPDDPPQPRRTLVLDDLQVLRGPALRVVAALAAECGDHLAIAIASRCDPDLSLSRLRVEGRLGELRADDLAFTPDEAVALLAHHGLALRPDQVQQLLRRTQGWAAGLRLAALSLEGEPDVERFLEDFAGDDHAVADYLSREVLAQQRPETRAFLVRTSVADRLCGELADALTGGSGGGRTLTELHEAGLFLQRLDRQDRTFRYHPLFAELLRARLALEHPDLERRLHGQAACWLAARGRGREALPHALRAGDPGAMADLLSDRWLDLLLGSAPAETVLAAARLRPSDRRLAVVAAAACVDAGDGARAAALLAAAPQDEDDDAGLLAALLRARATRDVAAARRSAARLLRHQADDGASAVPADHARRSLALLHLGATEFDAGSPAAAEEALEAACALAVDTARDRVLLECLGRGAALEVLAGRLTRADAAATAALGLGLGSGGHQRTAATAWARVSLAAVHWLRDDLDAAESAADQAMSAAHAAADLDSAHAVRLLRAHLAAARGDGVRARALHQAVRDALPGAGPVVRAWSACLGPCAWEVGSDGTPTDPLVLAAGRLRAGDALSALRRADAVLDSAVPVHLTRRLHGWLIAAVARHALGHTREAAEAVERALELAAPDGYRRPFADGGAAVRRLLQRHAAQPTAYAPLVAELIEALERGSAPAGGLVEPLSQRERDVLRLLPTLLPNTEIAGELFVSVNTVKTHVKSIYRKLEVSSRPEAVARARELRLL